MPLNTENMDALLSPSSIAIIGASATPGKLGGVPVRMLQLYGYKGRIFPINPTRDEILGLPAYKDIASVGEPIDLAIIAIPADRVIAALEDCAAGGVRGAVIFSSGFAELGEEGRRAQARMSEIAEASGMRILGPNCLGLVNVARGVTATFSPFFQPPMKPDGSIGLVSQSGAFGGYVANLASERGLSFSSWITTGNESDIDLCDAVAFQADQDATKVILAYIEGVRDGGKLIAALEKARSARKPVVVLKVGKTAEGAKAASSHTGSLAGEDAVYDAVFRQCGTYRAHSVNEWFNLGYAFAVGKAPTNADIGILSVSGGVGVMMADEAVEGGLKVVPLSENAQAGIKELIPYAGTANPVDMTGNMVSSLSKFGKMIDIVLEDRPFGSLVSFNAGAARTEEQGFEIQKAWASVRETHPDIHIAVTGSMPDSVRTAFEESGCAIYMEPDAAVRAAAAMNKISAALKRAPAPTTNNQMRQDLPSGTLNEVASMRVLGAAGIPVLEPRLAKRGDEAATAAQEIGFPVVLKIVSEDIVHKSDVGGVALNIASADAAVEAFERCVTAAKQHKPDAKIDGCLVAPMVRHNGVETILGIHIDPVFGPVIMFGLGGILVEVNKDVAFRVAPFGLNEAHALIDEIKARAILDGVRGKPPTDIDALAGALVALSEFADVHRDSLLSVDVNPFVVDENGKGAFALDAVVSVK